MVVVVVAFPVMRSTHKNVVCAKCDKILFATEFFKGEEFFASLVREINFS